tara:strand:- start:504 stop:1148 length:645 start_codon:yes stop_codon:yes gene_type:complete
MNNDPENIMPVNSNVMEFSFFSEEECNGIKEYCHNVEKKLIDDGHNKDTGHESLGDVITTVNYFRYNFFADNPQYAERLVNCLRKTNQYLEWPIVCQSWVNLYHKGQGIGWHNHQGTMGRSFSANIFIDGPTKPGITFKQFGEKGKMIENKKGYIQIFPCELMHMVPPTEEERITVGITIHSYPSITRGLIDQLAFNSQAHKGSIILTRKHYGN